jgi:hypothetical protein
LTDQPTAKPSGPIYEDTAVSAPLVYFDIVGAYDTMNGSIDAELATRILIPRSDGSTDVSFWPPDGSDAPRTPPPICATHSMPY